MGPLIKSEDRRFNVKASNVSVMSGKRKLTPTVVCPEEPAARESGPHVIWNSLCART